MIFGFVALVLLGTALVLARSEIELRVWNAHHPPRRIALGVAAIALASFPVALLVPPFSGEATVLPGDARSHALVARAIARGIPHWWTDAVQGGFPIGPHYPSLGLGVSAFAIRLGASPATAVQSVALLCVIGAPLALFFVAIRNGASILAATAGAISLSWVTPFNPFVGGYGTYFSTGLVSQVVCLPFIVLTAGGVFGRGAPWMATLPAVLAMTAHPQIAMPCIVALFPPVLATWDRRIAVRYVRVAAAAGLVGAAIYGPGIASLRLPFGWPPLVSWKLLGFGTDHLVWWFRDGDLLDSDRAPILTTVWGSAVLVLLLRVRRPAARAALTASFVTVALAVSGRSLRGLGSAGAALLTFVQPLRMVALVPIAAAATTVVAIEEAAPFAHALLARALMSTNLMRPWMSLAARGALLAIFVAALLPSELAWSRSMTGSLHAIRRGGACGASTPVGFDEALLGRWLRSLEGGRLMSEDPPEGDPCSLGTNFELQSSVPIAVTSALGGHVGVQQVAFHAIHPEREGSAARAEALGVRFALTVADAPVGSDWELVDRSGKMALYRRRGGNDYVGAACVTATWRGSDAALRERLMADLGTDRVSDRLLDPVSLVALETTSGAVTESGVANVECNARGAVIHEIAREPGAYEAQVETPDPVDVVFRATYFPTWRVEVDGARAPVTVTAPGFFAVRVDAGKHHVSAVVGPLPYYFLGILVALGLAIAVSTMGNEGLSRTYASSSSPFISS